MATSQMALTMEPATGQSFECWLTETLSASGTGSVFSATDSQKLSTDVLLGAVPAQPRLMWAGSQEASGNPVLILTVSDKPFFKLASSQLVSEEANSLASLIAYRHGITDPDAGFRLREPEMLNWTRNLHDLSVVSRMILPGIRELTEPEQRNLRGIYKKLYRKA